MIKSMTGFGKSDFLYENRNISIEIKSLNSKQLDINLKLPSYYKEKELEIRNFFNKRLDRGKFDITISLNNMGNIINNVFNIPLIEAYYNELKTIKDKFNDTNSDIFSMISKISDVFVNEKNLISEEEMLLLLTNLNLAISELNIFRIEEGEVLKKDFLFRIKLISEHLNNIEQFEKARIDDIKVKIKTTLNENLSDIKYDKNRFEQEIIYYIDKLDITEEKIRLSKHLEFFQNTINEEDSNGKKLSFITQEIGREINTIGSKANNFEIQQIVVYMKDELEKIKEQLLNIL